MFTTVKTVPILLTAILDSSCVPEMKLGGNGAELRRSVGAAGRCNCATMPPIKASFGPDTTGAQGSSSSASSSEELTSSGSESSS